MAKQAAKEKARDPAAEPAVPNPPNISDIPVLKRLWLLAARPREFFALAGGAASYHAILSEFALLLAAYVLTVLLLSAPRTLPGDVFSVLGVLIGGALTLLIVLAGAHIALAACMGAVHIAVLLLGGRGGLRSTLRAVANAWEILLAYALAGTIALLLLGLAEGHGTMTLLDGLSLPFRLFPVSKIVTLLLVLLSLLHSFVFAVAAIRRYHGISVVKALVVAIILSVTMFFTLLTLSILYILLALVE